MKLIETARLMGFLLVGQHPLMRHGPTRPEEDSASAPVRTRMSADASTNVIEEIPREPVSVAMMTKKPTKFRFPMTACILLSAAVLSLVVSGAVSAQDREAFDPARAFCERQTFELKSFEEVAPWLDYVGGLRTGRSTSPESGCPSATVRAILAIVGSSSVKIAEARRSAFHAFYTAKALRPDSSERAIDTDGSFRYRNDATLAGFVWLLCPGTSERRFACVKRTVGEFPTEFIRTSPVFCDFGALDADKVERPPGRTDLTLECGLGSTADPDAWMRRAASVLGE